MWDSSAKNYRIRCSIQEMAGDDGMHNMRSHLKYLKGITYVMIAACHRQVIVMHHYFLFRIRESVDSL